jgi:hypothetical protein
MLSPNESLVTAVLPDIDDLLRATSSLHATAVAAMNGAAAGKAVCAPSDDIDLLGATIRPETATPRGGGQQQQSLDVDEVSNVPIATLRGSHVSPTAAERDLPRRSNRMQVIGGIATILQSCGACHNCRQFLDAGLLLPR